MTTNYVDPAATRPVNWPCRCPVEPRPHPADTADVVVLFGYGERAAIRQAGRQGGPEAFKVEMLVRGIRRWNLVLPDGSARPLDRVQLEMLDEGTVDRLVELLDGAFAEDPLPNESGVPSPDGVSERDTPTQTTPPPESSTST